jgi:hypothetical protein
MPAKSQHIRATNTTPHPPHEPQVPHVPFKKDEQEVRRKHDTPAPKHHDPEEEGVIGETDRPEPSSDKPGSKAA